MATITLPSGVPERVAQIIAKLAEASLADSGTASVRHCCAIQHATVVNCIPAVLLFMDSYALPHDVCVQVASLTTASGTTLSGAAAIAKHGTIR